MRIIGGALKGKKLCPVRGNMIRPTADRLRETLFNILSARVQGAIVLDLFAGTGAFGIEALSRGATLALFVDKNKGSISLTERNVQQCALESRSRIIKWDIVKNLNCIKSFKPAFNLAFMDPPYSRNIVEITLENLFKSGCLAPGALIVVEHTPLDPISKIFKGVTVADQRKYGKTLVSFLNYMV